MEKTISIQCTGADRLPLEAIEEFQGPLKKRSKEEIGKIKTSIEKYGFSFPFFVWNGTGHNYCLDGHGRIEALVQMRKEGYILPSFPVAYIEAKDEEEAKNKLLRLNSQYGHMTVDSVLEFMDDLHVDWGELQLPADDYLALDETGEPVGPDDSPAYTTKIKAPNYEITGEKPETEELVNTEKYEELSAEIQGAELPPEVAQFLEMAATRHLVFDYSKIAEFYAHANPEIQDLMERSALVIIDFDKAIENGYVKLSEKIQTLYAKDNSNG